MRPWKAALLQVIIVAATATSGAGEAPAVAALATVAPAPVKSPEVLADRRVVFRLDAPRATEVTVAGDFWVQQNRTEKLVKGANGLWSLTTEPLPADVYSYFYTVDGVPMPDPVNGWVKQGARTQQSQFAVRGPGAELLEVASVPHGEVRVVTYAANALGKPRRMHVYLPPGYDTGNKRYPVVYLFHGGGDDDWGWVSVGHVDTILDNLIAQGQAQPMIVVMPSLWALDPPLTAAQGDENLALFRKSFFADVVPWVESHYRALPGPANRAAGGLGAGRNWLPDFLWPSFAQFDTTFFVSGGADAQRLAVLQQRHPGVLDDPANARRMKWFLGDGANDASIASSRDLAAALKQRRYRVTAIETEGTHGWPSFRRCFIEFAKTAFKP